MAIMELIFFAVSILPVVLIGWFIYRKDREKENYRILIKLFLGGMASCFVTLILTAILNHVFPFFASNYEDLNLFELVIYVFIGVALIEEFSKWLMAFLISYNDSAFDEFYDAIMYCIFVALGFACFENLLYVYQNGLGTGITRAILAVPGHACDGMFMGYYFGLSKIGYLNNRKDIHIKNLVLSILVPTITHGIYDYCLFSNRVILIILFFVFVISMYIYVFQKVKKISKINRKMKYKDNYCPNCGHIVDGNYCPTCGRKNE